VVTFVDDQMPVLANQVAHLAIAHEALDECDVDLLRGLAFAAADGSNADGVDGQEGPQPLAPLIDEACAR